MSKNQTFLCQINLIQAASLVKMVIQKHTLSHKETLKPTNDFLLQYPPLFASNYVWQIKAHSKGWLPWQHCKLQLRKEINRYEALVH